MKRIDRTTELEDLVINPEAYGLPTLEQYAMLKDQLWGKPDDVMAQMGDGPQMGRRDLKNIFYEVNGKRLSSENEVERALGDHGYSISDIDIDNRNSKLQKKIEMIPLGGGKFDIVVNFIP